MSVKRKIPTEDAFHLGVKGLIRNSQGQVLLLKVNIEKLDRVRTAYWDLPGGRVQKGDTVLSTLQREIKEETGIQAVSDPREIGMVLANIRIPVAGPTESVGLILAIYSCLISPGAQVTLSDEHVACDWFDPQQAAELLKRVYPDTFCALIAKL